MMNEYFKDIKKPTGLQKKMHPKNMLPKVGAIIINLIKLGPRVALRSTMQLLRVNIYTRIITSFLVLIFDFYNYMTKKISKKQLAINSTLSLTLLVGGTVGWYSGEFLMRGIILENTILWFAACFVASGLAGVYAEKLISTIIYSRTVSDMKLMLSHFNNSYDKIIQEQNIPPEQAQTLCASIQITEKDCLNTYKSVDKEEYTYNLLKRKLEETTVK